jgi:hypothetical protein
MSLVDWAKAAHLRVTDSLCPQRIVFHHVPKCGGTSVGRALRRAYILSQATVTPEESYQALAAIKGRAQLEASIADNVYELRELMLLYLLYSDVRCVAAHIPFSSAAFDIFHGRYFFVTLLRDPVQRFVSNYLWSYKRSGAHARIDEELGDFLCTDRAKASGSTYVRYLCGQPGMRLTEMHAAVDLACTNLQRLDHVGFLDRMEPFASTLRGLTGRRLRIGRENVGNRHTAHDQIMGSPLKQKILDVCAPDLDVWDAAREFWRDSYGQSAVAKSVQDSRTVSPVGRA